MYVFRNKKGTEITLSKEEIDYYTSTLEVKGIKEHDVRTISIPSDEETDEGFYLVEWNGYTLYPKELKE